MLELARARGTAVVASPLDSYVSARMITLSAPCRALMDREPLVVSREDLVADVTETVKEVDYRAAIVVDGRRRPIGLVTRSDLVDPAPRQVLLVDHAEQAQSVAGVEHAEIVEILDHHHIGSIETRVPVRATFDPVGSTATLVIERFRQSGMEPSEPAATLLLGAILSDTVILNSPTTTDRDRAVVEYLERVLDAGRQRRSAARCSSTPPTSRASPRRRSSRATPRTTTPAATRRCASPRSRRWARRSAERRDELLAALDAARERSGHAIVALMVTDILAQGHGAVRVRRARHARARVRRRPARRRRRPAGRDEPQEAGRAEAARRARGRRLRQLLFAGAGRGDRPRRGGARCR